jgi:phosphopantothenoylcysteine synthetase/decarboxylase
VTAPKPAANPLQFIKVGPASLYKSAQEQLKKVEEIKKVTKEVRDEAEDWQSVSGGGGGDGDGDDDDDDDDDDDSIKHGTCSFLYWRQIYVQN